MDTCTYILLADGTYAAVCQRIDYGQIVLVLLLVAMLVLQVYDLWCRHR